jgi:hypothetical protein
VRFLRSSAPGDRIEASDSYELLAALQHDFAVTARVGQQLDRRRQSALAATIVAFIGADLLVACSNGVIAGFPGTDHGTVVAATDDEAAQAYLDALAGFPRAQELEFTPLTAATEESPSQAVWLGAIHRHGADHVVVNPAGPAGSARFDRSVIRDVAPLLPKIRAPHLDKQWLSRSHRRQQRDHITASIRRLAGVARSREPGSFATVHAESQKLMSFNSPLVADTTAYLEGLARLYAAEQLEDGLVAVVAASVNGARDGFPEHCVDGILESTHWLLDPELHSATTVQALLDGKRALEGLLRSGLQWRTEEVEQFIAEAARAIAAANVTEQ